MHKEPIDLRQRNSPLGERWERLLTEESYLTGFQACGGTSSDDVTEGERLVDRDEYGGVCMFVSVIQADKLGTRRHKACPLRDSTHHRLCRRLSDISPPAWDRP